MKKLEINHITGYQIGRYIAIEPNVFIINPEALAED